MYTGGGGGEVYTGAKDKFNREGKDLVHVP